MPPHQCLWPLDFYPYSPFTHPHLPPASSLQRTEPLGIYHQGVLERTPLPSKWHQTLQMVTALVAVAFVAIGAVYWNGKWSSTISTILSVGVFLLLSRVSPLVTPYSCCVVLPEVGIPLVKPTSSPSPIEHPSSTYLSIPSDTNAMDSSNTIGDLVVLRRAPYEEIICKLEAAACTTISALLKQAKVTNVATTSETTQQVQACQADLSAQLTSPPTDLIDPETQLASTQAQLMLTETTLQSYTAQLADAQEALKRLAAEVRAGLLRHVSA